MSSEEPSDRLEEILRRLDPKGEFEELTRLFAPLVGTGAGQELLRLAGVSPDRILGPLRDAQGIALRMAQAVALFVPLGWAPLRDLPPAHEEALTVLADTGSTDAAEAVLVAGWNEKDRLLWAIKPVSGLGRPSAELSAHFHRRSVLIHKALSHHQNGAYEASVPIVLAQIDGIVWDLTTPPTGFFTGKGGGDHLVDETTIAGLPDGLKPLRALFARDMPKTASTGRLTRHGILHGRELGYDTKINSTKVFVLLLAVIEWAKGKRQSLTG